MAPSKSRAATAAAAAAAAVHDDAHSKHETGKETNGTTERHTSSKKSTVAAAAGGAGGGAGSGVTTTGNSHSSSSKHRHSTSVSGAQARDIANAAALAAAAAAATATAGAASTSASVSTAVPTTTTTTTIPSSALLPPSAQEQLDKTVNWASFPRHVLHTYRREHNLDTPAAFASTYHYRILAQPGGIGLHSPTMTWRRGRRRQRQEQLAQVCREHFDAAALAVHEDDVLVGLLHRLRQDDAANLRIRKTARQESFAL